MHAESNQDQDHLHQVKSEVGSLCHPLDTRGLSPGPIESCRDAGYRTNRTRVRVRIYIVNAGGLLQYTFEASCSLHQNYLKVVLMRLHQVKESNYGQRKQDDVAGHIHGRTAEQETEDDSRRPASDGEPVITDLVDLG
jgi:hypothetical protein